MEIDNGKKYNEAVKVHATVVETMESVGYGLLKDGETFYRIGMELAPRDGITFSMKEAYEIHRFLTTAMQRAYEAGESEQRERLLGEVKGMKTNLSARARGDDFISQIAIKEVQKHEWSYNQALDAVIEKIKQ